MVVPKDFVGKSLNEIKLRNRYGLEVLMIKQPQELFQENADKLKVITPESNYKLKRTDVLVLFGRDEKIRNFENI